jgi:hypothetical protein
VRLSDHWRRRRTAPTSGWCVARTVIHDVEIELISDVDSLDGANSIEVWAPSGRFLTPENARHLAVQLVRVSLQAEGRGRGTVAVAANLVRLAGERQPMDVDDVERLASVLGVSATKLFSNWRSLDVKTAPPPTSGGAVLVGTEMPTPLPLAPPAWTSLQPSRLRRSGPSDNDHHGAYAPHTCQWESLPTRAPQRLGAAGSAAPPSRGKWWGRSAGR